MVALLDSTNALPLGWRPDCPTALTRLSPSGWALWILYQLLYLASASLEFQKVDRGAHRIVEYTYPSLAPFLAFPIFGLRRDNLQVWRSWISLLRCLCAVNSAVQAKLSPSSSAAISIVLRTISPPDQAVIIVDHHKPLSDLPFAEEEYLAEDAESGIHHDTDTSPSMGHPRP
ncbi:hypothetical protein GLOTRDRAFT_125017 [Gloeophyllum trabeum ATCC 11539]|uniref:Uncharacterized protein n=1 Tax=Gloeophyllum trabeum (strain ATCC 11539 / FP-39264 / Madison 617) TaxID=670483 RepID=S7S5L9_GLOTA|nr:uncharacterized protein GLOTRDRAFT_125017 [Gloeophyllum trabeum ATCC 11539]EPQ61294.1 hypothetical protein GLOTRDRAFT_125017 [Gloeophyllum trabeum ATCC 11539]